MEMGKIGNHLGSINNKYMRLSIVPFAHARVLCVIVSVCVCVSVCVRARACMRVCVSACIWSMYSTAMQESENRLK